MAVVLNDSSQKNIEKRNHLKTYILSQISHFEYIEKNINDYNENIENHKDSFPFSSETNTKNKENTYIVGLFIAKILTEKLKVWKEGKSHFVSANIKLSHKTALTILSCIYNIDEINDFAKIAAFSLDFPKYTIIDCIENDAVGMFTDEIENNSMLITGVKDFMENINVKCNISTTDLINVFYCDYQDNKFKLINKITNYPNINEQNWDEEKKMLIDIINELNEEATGKLLEFITGTKCYTDLIHFYRVRDSLFQSHTCSNEFGIPLVIENKEKSKEKLLMSIYDSG